MPQKYKCIVADPPWEVRKIARHRRPNQVCMDYPTMTVGEIAQLPIRSLADEECWLFLWTTQKYLFDARGVLCAWGFNYLCTGTWEKTFGRSAGMPLFGFLWNIEFYLIGYKRKPELWPSRKLIPLAFSAENVRHSQKPEIFQDRIESMTPGPYLELFARRRRPGWDAWGNEVESDIELVPQVQPEQFIPDEPMTI